jgi:hypothetical protein
MSIWQLGFTAILVVLGYTSGFQHGGDRQALDLRRASGPVEVTVASPFATTCSAILEAAWAVEDAPPAE